MSVPGGIDWAGLMRLAICEARLRPAEFWVLSPAELMLVLGIRPAASGGRWAMSRDELAALMSRFPDSAAHSGA